jgi:hypothetical protein
MYRSVRAATIAGLVVLAASPLAAQGSLFTTGYDRANRPVDCPDRQGGAQASTPDDTYGCWAALADSRPFASSWLDVSLKPAFALVYVNGRYVGTAEQFTKPFRPLRIGVGRQHVEFRAPGYRTVSFWLSADNGRVVTASGTLIKNP